ncbi:hypothetical protein C0995_007631 [Termitomyces sp. Mi166|nr:hypothetical protein C0995_007631 [Termitomyces sp. Mi166\
MSDMSITCIEEDLERLALKNIKKSLHATEFNPDYDLEYEAYVRDLTEQLHVILEVQKMVMDNIYVDTDS